MPIYMRFTRKSGQVIKGDVKAAGHEGWISLASAELGVLRSRSSPSSPGVSRLATLPAVHEVVVTKDQDGASDELFKLSVWGEPAKVELDFVKADSGKEAAYMSVMLEGVLLTSYSVSGHGGAAFGKPLESLALNAQKMSYATFAAGRLVTGARATASP